MALAYIKLCRCAVLACAILATPANTLLGQRISPAFVLNSQFRVQRGINAQDEQAVLVIGGALIMATIMPDVLGRRLPYATCAPCDSTRVMTWGIDRIAVGPYRAQWSDLSWFTLIGTVGGALMLVGEGDDGIPASNDRDSDNISLMYVGLVNAAATTWLKILFHRPRPIRYTEEAARYAGRDNGRSFPSGHASTTFAMAAGATALLAMRDSAQVRAPVIALLFSGAAATSALRVAAHRHFPTDVLAGAILGTAIGFIVPRMVK